MIFDAGPGELFVVRNVANLMPEYAPDRGHHGTCAAIEFAIKGIGVRNIVVLGHGGCGGIKASLEHGHAPLDEGDFIGKWMSMLGDIPKQFEKNQLLTPGERQTILERISIRNSISNLRTFPYARVLEEEGELALHGAWFDIATGELWVMEDADGNFGRKNYRWSHIFPPDRPVRLPNHVG